MGNNRVVTCDVSHKRHMSNMINARLTAPGVMLAASIPLAFGGPTATIDLIHALVALTIVLICRAAVVTHKSAWFTRA